MNKAGLIGALILCAAPSAFADTISLTPGEWTHERSTAVRGAPRVETSTVCVTAETTAAAMAEAFNQSLFCEAQNLSETETGASFTMNCGLGSMYRNGNGSVSVQSSEAFTINAEARLNVPGSAQIFSTITETATRTGECSD